KDLDWMSIRIFEIKRRDSTGILVPVRQKLRAGGRVLYSVLTQPGIGPIHIANDDCNVLEPAIIAARINGDGTAFGREVFVEFDNRCFIADLRRKETPVSPGLFRLRPTAAPLQPSPHRDDRAGDRRHEWRLP